MLNLSTKFFFHFDSQIDREFWTIWNELGVAAQKIYLSIKRCCSLKGPVMTSLKYFIMKKMEKGSFFPHGDTFRYGQHWSQKKKRYLTVSQYKAECCRYDEFSTYLRLFWMYIHHLQCWDKLTILVGMLFFLRKMCFDIEGHINYFFKEL